jgi:hypothetical protein
VNFYFFHYIEPKPNVKTDDTRIGKFSPLHRKAPGSFRSFPQRTRRPPARCRFFWGRPFL